MIEASAVSGPARTERFTQHEQGYLLILDQLLEVPTLHRELTIGAKQ